MATSTTVIMMLRRHQYIRRRTVSPCGKVRDSLFDPAHAVVVLELQRLQGYVASRMDGLLLQQPGTLRCQRLLTLPQAHLTLQHSTAWHGPAQHSTPRHGMAQHHIDGQYMVTRNSLSDAGLHSGLGKHNQQSRTCSSFLPLNRHAACGTCDHVPCDP